MVAFAHPKSKETCQVSQVTSINFTTVVSHKRFNIAENLTNGKSTGLVVAGFGTSDGGHVLPLLNKKIGEVSFLFIKFLFNGFEICFLFLFFLVVVIIIIEDVIRTVTFNINILHVNFLYFDWFIV